MDAKGIEMTSQEHKQLASKIKQTAKEVAKDPLKSKELLVAVGICDKKGNLKKSYR